MLEALKENHEFFSDLVWLEYEGLNRKTEDFVEYISGAMVSQNFFRLFGVAPILGRTFAQDEATRITAEGSPERDSVIVLSYSAWQSLFGGDLGALGKTLELSGCHFTVIGIMPPEFGFPAGYSQCWWPAKDPRPSDLPNTQVLVRLKSGVSERQTKAMLDTVARRLSKDPVLSGLFNSGWHLEHKTDFGFWMRPLRLAFTERKGVTELYRTLLGLLAAIGFVLLIECANIANLMLARTERRQPEMAIRAALGAGRFRLLRQFLTESVLLACAGGLGGLRPRFPIGAVVITPNALDKIPPVRAAIRRHGQGDWGDLDSHDREENERALKSGGRLLTVYTTRAGTRFYIITVAGRDVTTILLPEDY